MWLWCKSVAISRIGFGLRNPGQSQTLMRYRKFRFHAISADLQSVGQGWCPWRTGAELSRPAAAASSWLSAKPHQLMAPSSAAHSQWGHISFIYILRSSFYGGGCFDQYYFCFGSSGGDFLPPLCLSHPRRCTISFQKGDISPNQTNCLFVKFISCFILIVLNHLLFPPLNLSHVFHLCLAFPALLCVQARPPFPLLSVCLVFLVNGCQVFPV